MYLKNRPLAFVDLETTGLYAGHHEIIEICIIVGVRAYHVKVEPKHIERITEEAQRINGYTGRKWIGAINQRTVANEAANLLEGCLIVGHNPGFDYEFLEALLEQEHVPVGLDRRTIDTITLAHEHLVPWGLDSLSLDSIRAFLGWTVRPTHNALDDCKDTKRLYETLTRPHRKYWALFRAKSLRFWGLIK